MKLRPYQKAASDAVMQEWFDDKTTLVVCPTGTGKTVIATDLISRVQQRKGIPTMKTMFIAHRGELIWQAKRTMERAELSCQIEKAELEVDDSLFSDYEVVLAMVQTLNSKRGDRKRMGKFDPMQFGFLIVDEAHHGVAEMYKNVIGYFRQNPDLRVLGLTATPDRLDEEALGQMFDTVAYDYEILDAIKDGWLVPIEQQMVYIKDLDFSHIRSQGGDLNGAELAALMESEEMPQRVAGATIPIIGSKRTLVFCASVKQAEMMSEIFNRHREGSSAWVCGSTEETKRKLLLEQFSDGGIQIMCNCNCLSEGFDNPGVEVVVQARPTESRALYCLSEDTQILTPDGWSSSLSIGDKVAGFDGRTGEIRYVEVTDSDRRPLTGEERWVTIKSQCSDIKVTDNHRMLYDNSRKTGWKWKTARELAALSSGASLPVCGHIITSDIALTDDELRFIGWVMTDGSINKIQRQVTITQGAHQPWLEEIQRVIESCGFKHKRYIRPRTTQFNQTSECVAWTISHGRPRGSGKGLRGWGALEPYLSKDMSPLLMSMSERQFGIFAESMHLGDGSKQEGQKWKRGSYHITTKRECVANRLQMLAVTKGWRCSIGSYLGRSGTRLFLVHLKHQGFINVGSCYDGRPTFQIETPQPGDICWCVQNDMGTLVTRRNGKVCIVGNSQQIGRATRPLPGLVDGFETDSERRQMIALSHKPACLVVDFVGNSGKHKLMTTADILGGNVSDEVLDRAKKRAEKLGKDGKSARMVDVIEDERKRVAAEAEDRRMREAARRAKLVANVKFTTRRVNPFDAFDLQPIRERGWHVGKSYSEKQRQLLMKIGADPDQTPYVQGNQLIVEQIRRWKLNLCTARQAEVLKRYGYETKDMTMAKAKETLDALAKNNWRKPEGVLTT